MCRNMKTCVFFTFASPAPRIVQNDRFVFSPPLRTCLLIPVGDSVLISSHVDSCPTTHVGFYGFLITMVSAIDRFHFVMIVVARRSSSKVLQLWLQNYCGPFCTCVFYFYCCCCSICLAMVIGAAAIMTTIAVLFAVAVICHHRYCISQQLVSCFFLG